MKYLLADGSPGKFDKIILIGHHRQYVSLVWLSGKSNNGNGMLLSVEQAFVGSECNPISPKNDCVGGYGFRMVMVVKFSVRLISLRRWPRARAARFFFFFGGGGGGELTRKSVTGSYLGGGVWKQAPRKNLDFNHSHIPGNGFEINKQSVEIQMFSVYSTRIFRTRPTASL